MLGFKLTRQDGPLLYWEITDVDRVAEKAKRKKKGGKKMRVILRQQECFLGGLCAGVLLSLREKIGNVDGLRDSSRITKYKLQVMVIALQIKGVI